MPSGFRVELAVSGWIVRVWGKVRSSLLLIIKIRAECTLFPCAFPVPSPIAHLALPVGLITPATPPPSGRCTRPGDASAQTYARVTKPPSLRLATGADTGTGHPAPTRWP
eukprot:3068283-Prymnesium_polylepis.2